MSYLLDTGVISEVRKRSPENRVVPIDIEIAECWGGLSAAATQPAIDGLLAATALTRGWTVVTRNVTDFASSGARVLNPWEHP